MATTSTIEWTEMTWNADEKIRRNMNDQELTATGVLKQLPGPRRIDRDVASPHLRIDGMSFEPLVKVNAAIEVNGHAMVCEDRSEIGIVRLVILNHHSAPAFTGARMTWLRGRTRKYAPTRGRHSCSYGI